MKNPAISSIRALLPSAQTIAGALTSGMLMEVGASLVKDRDVKDNVGSALGFAVDVGLELLGQKPLGSSVGELGAAVETPASGVDSASTEAAGSASTETTSATPAASMSSDPKKVPLAGRPAPRVGDWRRPRGEHIDWNEAMFVDEPQVPEWQTQYGTQFWRHPDWHERHGHEFRGGRRERILVSGVPEHAKIPTVGTSAPAASAAPAAKSEPAASAASAASVASVAPAVGSAASVRTMCTCAIVSGAPVLAGPDERIEFRQCEPCKRTALETVKYNIGMALGWADAFFKASGVNPMSVGDACGSRPDPNATSYRTSFGFNDRQYNVDLAGWQKCAQSTASAQAKLGLAPAAPAAKPAAASAAQAAPAAAPTPSDVAALKVAQVGRRSDKKLDAIKTEMTKATDPAQHAALKREADLASEKKHHAETIANHIQASPESEEHRASQAKLVAAIHEHAEKGPEVMESMLPSLYEMLPRALSFQEPPWGGPDPIDASQVFALDPLDPSVVMDFPVSDNSGGGDLSGLPELSVGAVPASDAPIALTPPTAPVMAPVASQAPPAVAPPIDGVMEAPPVGFSMEPVEQDEFGGVDDSVLEGLGDEERDLVVGYAQKGYSDEEVREYATMYRAAAGNRHENPGVCDTGCSLSRDRLV